MFLWIDIDVYPWDWYWEVLSSLNLLLSQQELRALSTCQRWSENAALGNVLLEIFPKQKNSNQTKTKKQKTHPKMLLRAFLKCWHLEIVTLYVLPLFHTQNVLHVFVGVLRIRLMKESSEPDVQYKRQRFSNEFKIYKTQKQIWL